MQRATINPRVQTLYYKITQEFLHRGTENNTNSQNALMRTCQCKEMNVYVNV